MEAIIITTYSKNEKYIDHCIKILNTLWPNHPKIYVLTDKGNFKYNKKVVIKDSSWIKVVAEGMKVLVENKKINNDDYIFLLLEDHIPLEMVPDDLINRFVEYIKEKKISFLSLTGHGGAKKITEIAGQEIFEIHEKFQFYSELHPAIWKVSHLINITKKALKVNRRTIWDLEHVRDSQVKHYTSGRYKKGKFIWPSFFGGFLFKGRLNIKALKKMHHPVFKDLKKILIKDYISGFPAYCCYRIKRKFNTLVKYCIKKN